MLLSELAGVTGAKLIGNDIEIRGIETLEDADSGDISFLFNKKYAHLLMTTKASAVILPDGAPGVPLSSLRSSNPHLTYARVMNIFRKLPRPEPGISEKAFVSRSAMVGPGVYLGPFVYVGENVRIDSGVTVFPNTTILSNVRIGSGSLIYSNVSIREGVTIGRNVIIQPGVTVGSDGFGFAKREDGAYEKIPHTGGVIIEDDVEIGANCTIDRASSGNTIIRKGAKLDNLVQVAHSVEVGENVLLVAQVGISGSSKIGDGSVLAGKASVTGHINIGKRCIVGPLAAVKDNLPDGSIVSGAPAFDAVLWKRAVVAFKKLPDLVKDVRVLKKNAGLVKRK